jgi:hypothetical protein
MPRKQISGNKQMLKLLFREVVEQIDEEHLEKLMDGYRSGKENIVFVLGENSRGIGYKTAFAAFTVPHSAWKLYTEPQETLGIEVPAELLGGSVFPSGSAN